VRVVDEEDATTGAQACGHESPERLEALGRDVGEPERERDDVVATVGLPAEDVRLQKPHALAACPCPSDGEHLGSCVDRGEAACVARQLLGPHAGSAGEL